MTERQKKLEAGELQDERESTGRRRFDKALPVITLAMAALALVSIIVAIAASRNSSEIETNADKVEKAVCAVIEYTERQSKKIRSPAASAELLRLGKDMRETGVRCPPASSG